MKLFVPQEVQEHLHQTGRQALPMRPKWILDNPDYKSLSADALVAYDFLLESQFARGFDQHLARDQEAKRLETLLGSHQLGVEKVLSELKDYQLLQE